MVHRFAFLLLTASVGCATSPAGGDASSSSTPSPASSSGDADACSGADFASDPKHCGGCNHDCLGGGCREGQCSEALLYESSQGCSLAAGGGFLWIGDPSRGIVVLLTEGEIAPREVVPKSTLENPYYVLRYGQDALFWNMQNHRATDPVPKDRKIFRTTIDGTTRPVLSLVDEAPGGGGQQLAYGFGVTRDAVYLYRPRPSAVAMLMRVDTAGRTSDVATLSGVQVVESLATQGERVAFFDMGLDVPQGRIGIIDGPGKTPRWIHPQERKSETRSSSVMGLDAEAVYAIQPAASDQYNWEIRRIPLAGGPTSVVIDTREEPIEMVHDATHHYVLVTRPGVLATDPRRTRLVAIAKEGGASKTLLDVEGRVGGLVYEGKSVYFVGSKDPKSERSTVFRLRVTKG